MKKEGKQLPLQAMENILPDVGSLVLDVAFGSVMWKKEFLKFLEIS